MKVLRVHGSPNPMYAQSQSEIEWSCCPGVICGKAHRTGVMAQKNHPWDGRACYTLSSIRHPELGDGVVVRPDQLRVIDDGQLKLLADIPMQEYFL